MHKLARTVLRGRKLPGATSVKKKTDIAVRYDFDKIKIRKDLAY
ncbi:MAG: hypothetical protein JG782_1234 [Anaerophaga sp.]|nr:hypothetical protein [Anaerophaga sp.]